MCFKALQLKVSKADHSVLGIRLLTLLIVRELAILPNDSTIKSLTATSGTAPWQCAGSMRLQKPTEALHTKSQQQACSPMTVQMTVGTHPSWDITGTAWRAGRGAERAVAVRGVCAAREGCSERAAVCDGLGRLGAGAAAAAAGRGKWAGRSQQQAGSQAAPPPPLPPPDTCLQLIRLGLMRNAGICVTRSGTKRLSADLEACLLMQQCHAGFFATAKPSGCVDSLHNRFQPLCMQ